MIDRLLLEVVQIVLIFVQINAKAQICHKCIKNAILYCVITQSKTNSVCTIINPYPVNVENMVSS